MIKLDKADLLAQVSTNPDSIEIAFKDRRAEICSLFAELSPDLQTLFASDAWTVGVRALSNARVLSQEARLQDVGKAILDDVREQLDQYTQTQYERITSTLCDYFDPSDGKLAERLMAFVADEGVIARLLDKYVGEENSVLAGALARQVGEQSPLFRKLDPNESEGLIRVIDSKLRDTLMAGNEAVSKALDPHHEGGAVSRFLAALKKELESASGDQAKQLKAALAALDANDENSLISRLVREAGAAREALLEAINPAAPGSPMAQMKETLTALLGEHARTQRELLEAQEERQKHFERDVRDALARFETKRSERLKGTGGGDDFEQEAVEFACGLLAGTPCTTEPTGRRPGAIQYCKKGDLVVRFNEESAYSGSGFVVEAKRDGSYHVAKAIEELDMARQNRGVQVGVFIAENSTAHVTFPHFARYGSNVLVRWDQSDPASGAYVHAALALALGLAARIRKGADAGDVKALQDVENRILAELERLEKMKKSCERIKTEAESITEEVRKSGRQLQRLAEDAKKTLTALNVELLEENTERKLPVELPSASLVNAKALKTAGPSGDVPAA